MIPVFFRLISVLQRKKSGNYTEDIREIFDSVKIWYDGYRLMGSCVYNPKAVVSVMLRGEFQSYWSDTGAYESIHPLINMDFNGLKTDTLIMLSGGSVRVKTRTFQNDMVTFRNKDDVLMLLIHLGYLGYDL